MKRSDGISRLTTACNATSTSDYPTLPKFNQDGLYHKVLAALPGLAFKLRLASGLT
jgi:hypothetical protein